MSLRLPKKYKLSKNKEENLEFLLLKNRNIEEKDFDAFLNPDYELNHDPFLLKDIDKAIKRFKFAIDNNERIVIYADYDADGIPGAAIFDELFKKIDYKNYSIYLPHRHNEGYGIHTGAIDELLENDLKLLISVDVGTTSFEEVIHANLHGIDVIIIDHHTPIIENKKEKLPEALAIINPKQKKCKYPEKMLCGAGVAYKFIQAFLEKYRDDFNIKKQWEKWLLDMVGIATISDMVPLLGENRIFAYFGLKVLQKTKRIGLRSLIYKVGASIDNLAEDDIAFSITPKINAASRMSHPDDALQLLIAKDEINSQTALNNLLKLNEKRKKLVANIMRDVKSRLKDQEIDSVIVLGDTSWNLGILGLVASKIVDEHSIPAFVWGEDDKCIKGSCRAPKGFDLVKIMEKCPEDFLLQYGGHKGAGGFSCVKDNVHFLEKNFREVLKNGNTKTEEEKVLIDSTLRLEDINFDNYSSIKKVSPFGMENIKPVFLFEEIIVYEIRMFGKGKEHLELSFKDSSGKVVKAISFFTSIKDFPEIEIETGNKINLIANFDFSIFMGRSELRLKIIDIF